MVDTFRSSPPLQSSHSISDLESQSEHRQAGSSYTTTAARISTVLLATLAGVGFKTFVEQGALQDPPSTHSSDIDHTLQAHFMSFGIAVQMTGYAMAIQLLLNKNITPAVSEEIEMERMQDGAALPNSPVSTPSASDKILGTLSHPLIVGAAYTVGGILVSLSPRIFPEATSPFVAKAAELGIGYAISAYGTEKMCREPLLKKYNAVSN